MKRLARRRLVNRLALGLSALTTLAGVAALAALLWTLLSRGLPGLGLDATFAVRHPQPGTGGLVVQSGGVGIALLEHFSRLGIGISASRTVRPSQVVPPTLSRSVPAGVSGGILTVRVSVRSVPRQLRSCTCTRKASPGATS